MSGSQRLASLLRPSAWKAAVAYAALTAFFTWPLVIRPAHWVFFGIRDTLPHLWNYWWIKRCLLTAASPFHTDLLFHPQGTSLALASVAYPYGLLSVPFQLIFGEPNGLTIGMTFTIFFSFIATGLGGYLLARDLTGSRAAGLVAGIAVAFTAYRVWHLGRMNVLGTEGIVLSLWLLFRVLRGAEARARDGVALSLAVAYTFYTDVTYTVYLAGLAAIIVLYHLVFERDRIWHRRCAAALGVGAVVAVGLCAPLLTAILTEMRRNPAAAMSLAETSYFSADLAGLFLPSHLHRLWGTSVAPLYDQAPQIKGYETYLGYTLLAFAACGLLAYRKFGPRGRRRVLLCAVIAAGSLILALGPTLRWMGHETSLPLPYRLLWYAIPILRVSRTPVRLVVIANLSLALLLAFAITAVRAGAQRRLAVLVPIGAALLMLAENICMPLPTHPVAIPAFYYQLAQDADDYAILEAPLRDEVLKRRVMVRQTVHHKPILYADVPRRSAGADDFINAHRAVLGPLLGPRLGTDGAFYLLPGQPKALPPVLAAARTKYVVVHRHPAVVHPVAVDPRVVGTQVEFLRAAGLEEVWRSPDLIAFRAY